MTDFNVRNIALLREVERVRTNYYGFWRWVFLFFAAACEAICVLVIRHGEDVSAVRIAGWLWVIFSAVLLGFALFCHLAVCFRIRNTYRRPRA